MEDAETYDLEAVYDEQIAPLMSRIISICREHNMPMLASFCYRQNEEGSDLCTTVIRPEDRDSDALRRAQRELFRNNA